MEPNIEIPDGIMLATGDIVPADIRLIVADEPRSPPYWDFLQAGETMLRWEKEVVPN